MWIFHVSFEQTLQNSACLPCNVSGCHKSFSQKLYQTPQVTSPQTFEWALPQGMSEHKHHVLPLKRADSLLLPARTAKFKQSRAKTGAAKTPSQILGSAGAYHLLHNFIHTYFYLSHLKRSGVATESGTNVLQ